MASSLFRLCNGDKVSHYSKILLAKTFFFLPNHAGKTIYFISYFFNLFLDYALKINNFENNECHIHGRYKKST